VTIEKRIEESLPRCSGDLIRSDRAIAIVLRTLLLELDAGGTIALRAFAEPSAVALEIRAPTPERRVLVETLAAHDPRVLLGESLGHGATVSASIPSRAPSVSGKTAPPCG